MNKKKKQISKEDAIRELWFAGELRWKLKGKQKDIYDHFVNNKDDISACLISRQFGKSFTLCLVATELCIKKPGAIVKYACPTQKMVERVIKPRMRDIITDCPDELKPEWKAQEKIWLFPNGSEIQIAGTDNDNYDNLRGGSADLCICDEAAFMSPLETIVYSVLAPTTDTTDGKIYLASTPNDKDPNHDFHELFVHPLAAVGKLLKFIYLDSPLIDEKKKDRILKRYPGGESNIKFRCEYLCEIPNVTESNIIPEFAKVEDEVVKEVEKPDYCDFYTSMDLGFKDLTIALFGYYDFKTAKLVITDEYLVNGPDLKTDTLDKNIRKYEEMNFHTQLGPQNAYMRVMDNNNLMLINELSLKYGLSFIPTEKHNKEQAVDTVRRWVEQKKIIIHPRCKNLIYHIRNGQWHITKAGTHTGKFRHLKGNESAGLLKSHADALDALIYMVRNIHTYRNPFPEYYGKSITEDTHISAKYRKKRESRGKKVMRALFGKKE